MSHYESTSTFSVSKWDEAPYREIDGVVRLTMAEVAQSYSGSLSGQSEIRYLMLYPSDGVTTFTGLEHFTGSLGGRDGSFGIRWDGEDDGTAARGRGTIVSGSGTGALTGLTGEASYEATRSGDVAFSISYTLDEPTRSRRIAKVVCTRDDRA